MASAAVVSSHAPQFVQEVTGRIIAEKTEAVAVDVGYTILMVPRSAIAQIVTESEAAAPERHEQFLERHRHVGDLAGATLLEQLQRHLPAVEQHTPRLLVAALDEDARRAGQIHRTARDEIHHSVGGRHVIGGPFEEHAAVLEHPDVDGEALELRDRVR